MKNSKWLWGIFFVLAAVFLVASQMVSFVKISFWSILGTLLLAVIMIKSIAGRNFFGIFFSLAFLYKIFCQPLGWVDISLWILMAAAALASVGFSWIFDGHPPKSWNHHKRHSISQTIDNNDDNSPYAKVSFGSSTKYLHSSALTRGQFYTSFGSLEIFMDQAQLSPEGAELYVSCSFGSIEIYVPRHWQVVSKVQATLGSAEVVGHREVQPDSPVLTVKGNVSFGSVEIKYV